MNAPEIVSREAWLAARLRLLEREKALTRQRDELSAARRALPWVKVDRHYTFESVDGEQSLGDLFNGCSQLAVYHFMFDTDWESGCKSCSFWADNFNGVIDHLRARDVAFVAVSKAPLETLKTFRDRMGWQFQWVRSRNNEFGRDFGVSFTPDQVDSGAALYNFGTQPAPIGELPGYSVFNKDAEGTIYHTYSCYARGLETLNSAYHHLDLMPKGRNERELTFPMAWVRFHDEYES